MPQESKRLSTAKTEWKPVPGYEGLYSVSNRGDVRREESVVVSRNGTAKRIRQKLLRAGIGSGGYRYATLSKGGIHEKRRVHYWVMLAFVGPRPDRHEVRHLNGDKADNHWPVNLAYGTSQQNSDDCAQHGRFRKGEEHQNTVLTDQQVVEARLLPKGAVGVWADRNGVSRGHVYNIRNRRRR